MHGKLTTTKLVTTLATGSHAEDVSVVPKELDFRFQSHRDSRYKKSEEDRPAVDCFIDE